MKKNFGRDSDARLLWQMNSTLGSVVPLAMFYMRDDLFLIFLCFVCLCGVLSPHIWVTFSGGGDIGFV